MVKTFQPPAWPAAGCVSVCANGALTLRVCQPPCVNIFSVPRMATMKDYNERLRAMGKARFERIQRMRKRIPPMTLEEIAALEGCTRQRISAIIQRGTRKANGK